MCRLSELSEGEEGVSRGEVEERWGKGRRKKGGGTKHTSSDGKAWREVRGRKRSRERR